MTDSVTDAPVEGQADGEEQTVAAKWYDGADDDTAGFIQNKKWDNALQAVSAYRNLEKFHGVPADQLIKIPKEGESYDAVYARLGRPESADKYSAFTSESMAMNEADLKSFDAVFHSAGLSDKQRGAILKAYEEYGSNLLKNNAEEIAREQQIQIDSLKKDWGNNYNERIELAKRAARMMFPDNDQRDGIMAAIEGAVGPAVVAKAFANIADKIGEDKIITGAESGTRAFGYTREQAVNDRNELVNALKGSPDRMKAYNKGVGEDYKKMQSLLKIIAEG